MSNTQLLDKIDAAIAEKNLLKHPFYQDWQAGKLSRESLRLYAAQYYRHVEAFPGHLRVLAVERLDRPAVGWTRRRGRGRRLRNEGGGEDEQRRDGESGRDGPVPGSPGLDRCA